MRTVNAVPWRARIRRRPHAASTSARGGTRQNHGVSIGHAPGSDGDTMSSLKRLLVRGVLPAVIIGATWSSAALGHAHVASTNAVPAKLCTLKLEAELRVFPLAVHARDTCRSRPPATPGAQGGTLYEADVGEVILTVESHFLESVAVVQKRRLDATSIEQRVSLGS